MMFKRSVIYRYKKRILIIIQATAILLYLSVTYGTLDGVTPNGVVTSDYTNLRTGYFKNINLSPDSVVANDYTKLRTGYFKSINFSCADIIEGNNATVTAAKLESRKMRFNYSSHPPQTLQITDCELFLNDRGYYSYFITEEERQFPIAFNILYYKDLEQVELLLRTIYRPHNFYCLHIDGFSPAELHFRSQQLASCFDNVFIVTKTENITYAHISRLQADINCMADHLSRDKTWKYLINLPGQQFPLKTNYEMVKILQIYNNSNDIEGKTYHMNDERFIYKYKLKASSFYPGRFHMVRTRDFHVDPPHGLQIIKGSVYGVFTRQFVDYVVNNQVAHDLLTWSREIYSPDEYYWSMLNHNPQLHVPGGYKGDVNKKPFLAVYVAWRAYGIIQDKCHGLWMRQICIFGVGDLHNLVQKKQLFVNKLRIDYDPIALQCMSEWIHNKTRHHHLNGEQFYKQLPFINNNNNNNNSNNV